MRQRSLLTAFVLIALLLSAWGNVIAGAACPRFANRDCCLKHAAQQAEPVRHESSCHHPMANMEMDDLQTQAEIVATPEPVPQTSQVELTSEPALEEIALVLPIEQCAHCLSHSQPISGTASVVTTEPSNRSGETGPLPANHATGLASPFAHLIAPSEHSPPGASSPRHLMINVFRI